MSRFADPRWASHLGNSLVLSFAAAALIGGVTPPNVSAPFAQAIPASPIAGPLTIVLPPRLVAGQPATLAVTDAAGKLVAGATVELASGERVTTDRTGRAYFTAPASGSVLIAKGDGTAAAVLIDPLSPADAKQPITVAPDVSLRDRFSICGGGLRGDADAYQVTMNGEPGLVIAASPACVVVLAGAKAEPGPAAISLEAGTVKWTASTSLVSLAFEPPHPALLPGQKGKLTVHVHGSERKLNIVVENGAPSVLQFLRGDVQNLGTSGGPQNFALIEVKALRAGDFSFHTRLLAPPDATAARRFLQAAEPLAPHETQRSLHKLADQLARHPRDVAKVRQELASLIAQNAPGDLHTLLAAAESAL